MTEEKDSEQLASLGEPEHIVRQRLKDDPATHQIAESLGVEIDTYVDQVIFYMRRPHLSAQVEIIDDEELEEAGVELPTEGEVQAWLAKVESGEIDLSTPEAHDQVSRFTKDRDERDVLRAAMGERPVGATEPKESLPAPVAGGPGASVLKQQLLQQRDAQRLATEARRHAKAAPPPKKN